MTKQIVESPCINLCRVRDNVCIGCKRTIQEISKWSKMSDSEKKQVVDRIKRGTKK